MKTNMHSKSSAVAFWKENSCTTFLLMSSNKNIFLRFICSFLYSSCDTPFGSCSVKISPNCEAKEQQQALWEQRSKQGVRETTEEETHMANVNCSISVKFKGGKIGPSTFFSPFLSFERTLHLKHQYKAKYLIGVCFWCHYFKWSSLCFVDADFFSHADMNHSCYLTWQLKLTCTSREDIYSLLREAHADSSHTAAPLTLS